MGRDPLGTLCDLPLRGTRLMPAALVTGSGARLGKAMALYLASRGYDVGVHYASSSAGAAAVVADIQAMGRHAVGLQADLLDETATQGLIAKATAELGPLTVLVNNATIFEHDTISTATRGSWDRHIESNLRAPFVLTQNFAMQAPDPIDDSVGEPVAQALVLNMLDQRVHIDARVYVLHHCKNGPLGDDANRCAGTCT